MTPKQIFLEMLKPDGRPDRQLKQYEALHLVLADPINRYLRGNRVKGSVNGISPKFPDFIKALDTDKDGNTGNIISVGKISGKFIGK